MDGVDEGGAGEWEEVGLVSDDLGCVLEIG